MPEYSKHQQNIIKRYYENKSAISIQRLQEIVTELYLTSGKKRERQWKLLATHLEKLEVPASQIQHLIDQDNPELVAQIVQKLISAEN
ncbi:MAG: hypothetical protein AAGF97_06745 [Planctomycetota bacterium]